MKQSHIKKVKQKESRKKSYATRISSPQAQLRLQKNAQTPFQRIRNKQKLRKERIHLSLSPTKHEFSLGSSRQFSSFYGSLRRDKHHQDTCKSERQSHASPQLQKQAQYQIAVRDSLRKMTNARQNKHQKIEDVSRRLVIEGANCGNDLISLNRHKLQQMIAQIQVNNTVLHQNYDIPQVMLQKGKYIRCRQIDKKAKRESEMTLSPEIKPRPMDNHLINAREFLICSPAVMEINQRNELSIEGSSAVVDISYKWEKVCALSPQVVATSRRARKTCKTEEIVKSQSPRVLRKSSPMKKGPTFNGFNLHNLKGWQAAEEPEQSFFQLALQ